MFKRLIIGLVAVGLAVMLIAEAGLAYDVRRRNTVENFHSCEECLPGTGINEVPCVPDPCFGADEVTDTLYGWDWDGEKATCTMTGTVVCLKENEGLCTDTNETQLTLDSFTAGATFITETRTASNLTVLPLAVGQPICDSLYGDGYIFSRFWPNVAVAYTIYTDIDGSFPNISGTEKTYELIELCTAQTNTDLYDCEKLWDSTSSEPPPKLPCCSENTLTVQIDPEGGGTVTSDDGKIDCPYECVATYNSNEPPDYDGCPEVTLTAAATQGFSEGLSGYEFTGWDGGGCTGTEPTCTTSAEGSPTVTANFEASYHTLTVIVNGDGEKDRVWIFDPRSDFDEPAEFYCYGPGTDNPCYKRYPPGTTVVLKRKGGTFDQWGGVCEGIPNSVDTCEIVMDGSKTAEVLFIN